MIPNYQNPYMNNLYQAPYAQNAYGNQQLQNYQVANNNQTIVGSVVNDFNSITANDVPMDGRPATFVKNDLSEIQLRSWTSNGQIQNIVFKPIENNEPNNSTLSKEKSVLALSDEVTALFDGINSRLDKIEKAVMPKTSTSPRKKVGSDE